MLHEYNILIAVHKRFQLAAGTSTASAGQHCQLPTAVKLEMRLPVQEFAVLKCFARLLDGHPARLPLTIHSKNRLVDHYHLNDKINSPEENTRWPNDAG